jgi:hypothetical protein
MAGHDGKNHARSANIGRRILVGMGAGAGVFFAAAAMATGSTVTAAPAKADFDALIDPIIQPLLTSLTDSIGAFDPAAALDLTNWTDSLLSSLNAIDFAVPSAAEPAAAVAAASEAAASTGPYDLPLTVLGGTEPTVQATIDGTSNTLLVDTGSSGLVIPWESLGSNDFQALENLFTLGFPSTFGESGYSGGVDYIYLTYDNLPVDYADGLTTNTPVDVEVFSWPTALSSPSSFEEFLSDDNSTGILGLGENTSGPGTSPFESFGSVTIDVPGKELIVGGDAPTGTTVSGAPTSVDWVSVNGAAPQEVTNDVDSGGATGALPASLFTTNEYNSTTDLVNTGTKIAVYADQAETHLLYEYTVNADNDPFVVSGDSTDMDSGIAPFLQGPIYMSYLPASIGTTIFG